VTDKKPALDRLNAYVDGELDVADAAAVAADIAEQPALGQTVASLHAVKSAVASAFDAPAELPPLPAVRPQRRLAAIAASGGLALVAATVLVWLFVAAPNHQQAVLSQAFHAYDTVFQAPGGPVQIDRVRGGIVVPDLMPAGLTVTAYHPAIALDGAEAVHIGYVGKRGCRLSLFIRSAGENTEPMAPRRDVDGLVEAWRFGAHDYLLIARRMDRTRFGVIADALKMAIRDAVPLAPPMRVALAEARQPCQA
jgi:hypothetical protein